MENQNISIQERSGAVGERTRAGWLQGTHPLTGDSSFRLKNGSAQNDAGRGRSGPIADSS